MNNKDTLRNGMLRRVACVLLAVMLTVLAPSAAWAAKGKVYVCIGDGVRVRQKPVSGSQVVGRLSKGEKVVHVSTYKGWWKIRTSDNRTGYVYGSYLRPNNVIKVGKTYKAKTSNVKIYAKANTNSTVRTKMGRNTVVVLLARKGNWGMVRVASSGRVGYVQLKYLQMR